jgi:hypothetical protein
VKFKPSPVASLNRAVAIGRVNGALAALDALAKIPGRSSLESYHLLGKENTLREIDLGMVGASSADTPITNILNRLTADGELEKGISVRLLLKNWPPAHTEWPVKSARDALYASPQFPRIIRGTEAIQDTVSKGVAQGELAYVGKTVDGKYAPFKFINESLFPGDVEVVDEMFLISRETANAYLKQQTTPAVVPGASPVAPGSTPPSSTTATSTPATVQSTLPMGTPAANPGGSGLSWAGEIPPQKWMNFYTKVLSKFASERSLKLTLKVEVAPEGGVSQQKRDETKSALRELGLNDDATIM